MLKHSPHPDRQRLELLLDGGLPAPVEAETADHLAACDTCRAALESLAAGDQWWREASELLRSAADEPAAAEALSGGAWSDELETDEAFLADFAVQYLAPAELPGHLGRLGDYDIVEFLGRGGMGLVFKAHDRELSRPVAVKVLAPHLASSAAARKRFAREAQSAAAIVHPHVMPIHRVDASGRLPYLVMPYVAGESLEARLEREGPLPVREALRIAVQAARGLAAAHGQGLVHRDVKPANILLERGVDRVLLMDFGLARAADDASLTRSGFIAGTPQYMSPEQARGEPLDARSDLFSLGSVLYAMCAGRPPFRAETTLGVLRRITDEQPRGLVDLNADVPAWLARIVERLHAKDATGRYPSAADVAELMEQCLAHVQQPAACPLPKELTAARRRGWRSAKLWGAASAAAIGTAAAVWQIAGTVERGTPSAGTAAEVVKISEAAATAEQRDLPQREDLPQTEVPSSTAVPANDTQESIASWHDGAAAELADIRAGVEYLESQQPTSREEE
jgi:serine/threonine-protein kinase